MLLALSYKPQRGKSPKVIFFSSILKPNLPQGSRPSHSYTSCHEFVKSSNYLKDNGMVRGSGEGEVGEMGQGLSGWR